MFDNPRSFFRGSLGTSLAVALGTVGPGTLWVVKNIVITSAPATLTDVPAATIYLAGVALLAAIDIPAKSVFTLDCAQVLTAGQAIAGIGSIAGLTCHISGIEVTL